LADINKQWFISKVELEVMQTYKIVAFSTFTILTESPDLLVVADAFSDERFSNNLLDTECPIIRFYAGAAIIGIFIEFQLSPKF